MKRTLLIILAVFAIATISASEWQLARGGHKLPAGGQNEQTITTRANEGRFVYGYCQDVADGLGTGTAVVLEAAIYLPKNILEPWIGNKITGVRIGFGQSTNKILMTYLTEDLTGYPFYKQYASMTNEFGWNTVILSQPFEIDGTPFYVGYQIETSESDYPIGVDLVSTTNKNASWLGINNEFAFYGDQFGSVCIQVIIEGSNNLPQNQVNLSDLDLMPYNITNEEFEVSFSALNTGSQPLTSLGVECFIDGEKIPFAGIELSNPGIMSGETTEVILSGLKYDGLGINIPIEIIVNSVNGEENENKNNTLNGYLSFGQKAYYRNVLVEEFTGTWCGYCPRGIVGMAYMEENYSDQGFIGVAVHKTGVPRDQMQSDTYVKVADFFSKGQFPSAVIDRTFYFDPGPETMEKYFLYQKKFPAFASVDVTADYNESLDAIDVKANVNFGLDLENAEFSLAFALVENGVGPYMQENYFSGGAYGELPGWSNNTAKVSTIFNEVGREIVEPFGIENSLPVSLKVGQNYSYATVLEYNSEKVNLQNCYVVAMILSDETKEVVNSSKCYIKNLEAGIDDIVSESGDKVFKVYNLQGVKILETTDPQAFKQLAPGAYVVNGKKYLLK